MHVGQRGAHLIMQAIDLVLLDCVNIGCEPIQLIREIRVGLNAKDLIHLIRGIHDG